MFWSRVSRGGDTGSELGLGPGGLEAVQEGGGMDGTRGPLVAVPSTAGGAGQGMKIRAAS